MGRIPISGREVVNSDVVDCPTIGALKVIAGAFLPSFLPSLYHAGEYAPFGPAGKRFRCLMLPYSLIQTDRPIGRSQLGVMADGTNSLSARRATAAYVE